MEMISKVKNWVKFIINIDSFRNHKVMLNWNYFEQFLSCDKSIYYLMLIFFTLILAKTIQSLHICLHIIFNENANNLKASKSIF